MKSFKKSLSIFLAVLTVITAIPAVTITADVTEPEQVVYTADMLKAVTDPALCEDFTVNNGADGLKFTASKDCEGGHSPNSETTTSFAVAVQPADGGAFDVDFAKYPYIAISYDTDIVTTDKFGSMALFPWFKKDSSATAKRSWPNASANYTYQLNATNNGLAANVNQDNNTTDTTDRHIYVQGFAFDGYTYTPANTSGTLPYSLDFLALRAGANASEIKKDDYFSVKWVGFFKTPEAAKAYGATTSNPVIDAKIYDAEALDNMIALTSNSYYQKEIVNNALRITPVNKTADTTLSVANDAKLTIEKAFIVDPETGAAIVFADYPYIAIGYNVSGDIQTEHQSRSAYAAKGTGGEFFAVKEGKNEFPAGSGKYIPVVIDAITGNANYNEDWAWRQIALFPYSNKTETLIDKDYVLDIQYIGLFKSLEDAQNYVHDIPATPTEGTVQFFTKKADADEMTPIADPTTLLTGDAIMFPSTPIIPDYHFDHWAKVNEDGTLGDELSSTSGLTALGNGAAEKFCAVYEAGAAEIPDVVLFNATQLNTKLKLTPSSYYQKDEIIESADAYDYLRFSVVNKEADTSFDTATDGKFTISATSLLSPETDAAILYKDYPVFAMGYRVSGDITETHKSRLAVAAKGTGGEYYEVDGGSTLVKSKDKYVLQTPAIAANIKNDDWTWKEVSFYPYSNTDAGSKIIDKDYILDISYIAFFKSVEDANKFDYAEYLANSEDITITFMSPDEETVIRSAFVKKYDLVQNVPTLAELVGEENAATFTLKGWKVLGREDDGYFRFTTPITESLILVPIVDSPEEDILWTFIAILKIINDKHNTQVEQEQPTVEAPSAIDAIVVGADALMPGVSARNMEPVILADGDKSFVRFTPVKEAHDQMDADNVNSAFTLGLDPFDVSEYPVMAVSYRSNITNGDGVGPYFIPFPYLYSTAAAAFDRTWPSDGTTSQFAVKPTDTSGVRKVVVDLSTLKMGSQTRNITSLSDVDTAKGVDKVQFRARKKTVWTANDFLDIEYIGFFKTVQDAEKYVYGAEAAVPAAPKNDVEAVVMDAQTLEPVISTRSMEFDSIEEEGKKLLRFTPVKDVHNTMDSDNVNFSFALDAGFDSIGKFDVSEYPFMTVSYRSNITNGDGAGPYFIPFPFLYSKATAGYDRVWPADGTVNSFTVKPIDGDNLRKVVVDLSTLKMGSQSKTITSLADADVAKGVDKLQFRARKKTVWTANDFVDIEYIAFFKTESEAKQYQHDHSAEAAPDDTAASNIKFLQAPDGYIAELDAKFEARKQEVLNTESEWTVAEGGKVYYVSTSGKGANDGLSAEAPMLISKLKSMQKNKQIKAGDVVLFKRGDEWHLGSSYSTDAHKFVASEGVTYSAYGEGPKPRLLGSIEARQDGKDHWQLVDGTTNLYKYDERLDSGKDVGLIIFNDGEGFAFRVLKQPKYDKLVACGTDGLVGNGYKTWTMDFAAHTFKNEMDMVTLAAAYPESDLMYYHNWDSGKLFMISKNGDPDDIFEDIDISTKGNGIRIGGNNITIDNLCVRYTGSHGIGAATVSNLTVRNCEVGWIGGSIQSVDEANNKIARYGNTIEIFGGCDGYYVYNNYNHNAFDCGPTVQWQSNADTGKPIVQKNIEIRDNVLWDAKPEIWLTPFGNYEYTKECKMENCHVTNNLITGAGYGFTGYFHSNTGYTHFYGAARPKDLYFNCTFEGNTFWNARRQIFVAANIGTVDGKGFNWKNNIIIHELDGEFGRLDGSPSGFATKYNEASISALVTRKIFSDTNTYYYTLPENK